MLALTELARMLLPSGIVLPVRREREGPLTASLLLLWISAALLSQVAVGTGIALLRRRRIVTAGGPGPVEEAPKVPLGAWPGWRDFRVARREFEDGAHTQCSFYLEPVDGAPLPPFRAGQFLTFSLELAGADAGAESQPRDRTVIRCYSLSDRPDSKAYRVTIKRLLAPLDRPDMAAGASSGHFHDRIHEGDVLKVKAPSGHFSIDPDSTVPAVLIAGGIGITPLMSMLRWSLAERPERTIRLYYALRNGDERVFKPQLEQLANSHPNFHLNVIYSRPGPNDLPGRDFQHSGHVDADLLRRTLPHGTHQFYVCGPAAMLESLVPALASWGVPAQDIHTEAFGPASKLTANAKPQTPALSPTAPFEVKFRRSGRVLVWAGHDANLLDFAERHGVAVDSGCRTGSCGTCETKLASGTVHYEQAPDHDVAPGHCLLCVATPGSALDLEA